MLIHPSIISCNFLDLKSEIQFIDEHFGRMHIDIEDGNYIRNITFGEKILKTICDNSKSKISVHLMMNDIDCIFQSLIQCNIDVVFIHIDHVRYPSELIQKFLAQGIEVGIALNPNAELHDEFYLKQVKKVLIMTSEPDGNNQEFIPSLTSKIKRYISRGYEVWCDGGIKHTHLEMLEHLGVQNCVMGRAIFENRSKL
jgi:protein sgcE